jgi:hypothetical protein
MQVSPKLPVRLDRTTETSAPGGLTTLSLHLLFT